MEAGLLKFILCISISSIDETNFNLNRIWIISVYCILFNVINHCQTAAGYNQTLTVSQSSTNKQLQNQTSPWLSDMRGYHTNIS